MLRFNIALLPKNKSNEFINFAAQFKKIETDYLLGNHSFPHITLAQFRIEETLLLDLWHKIRSHLSINEIILRLKQFQRFPDKKRPNYIWLGVLPDHNKTLFELHTKIARFLLAMEITCLNKSFDQYDPHLTLAHAITHSIQFPIKTNIDIEDVFYVALGRSDEIGQLVEIIC